MDKVVIGNKRICVACSARFYDLGKNPASCPKCRAINDINAPVRVRRKSKVVVEVDSDDPLVKQKAKQESKAQPKKAPKNVEGVDLEDFDDVVVVEGEDEIEAIEEIDDVDDIEDLEELEDVEPEEPMDDDIAIDDDTLIDEVEDGELEESEEEEEPAKPAKKSKAAKPAKGGKSKK